MAAVKPAEALARAAAALEGADWEALEGHARVRAAYLVARPAGAAVDIGLLLDMPGHEATRIELTLIASAMAPALKAVLTSPYWVLGMHMDIVAEGELPRGYEAKEVWRRRPKLVALQGGKS